MDSLLDKQGEHQSQGLSVLSGVAEAGKLKKKHLYRVSCAKKISAINYWAKSNLKFVSIYNKKLGLANSNPILKSDHSITSIISVHH